MTRARLMTYNIKNDSPGERHAAWTRDRREALVAVVREAAPDVAALQEVVAHQLAHLRADLPSYVAVGVGRDDGDAAGEHVPLLVRSDRWSIRTWGTFWLSPTPDVPSLHPGTHCARVCTWAVLDAVAGAGELRVWNVHLDHESEDAREFGMRLVLDRIAAAGPGRDVVLGDLNAGPGSAPVAAALTGLRDAREASRSAPTGSGATFHDWVPAAIQDSGGEHAERIDWVLVGPGIEVLAYDVPAIDETADAVLPSDHYPVVVDVEIGTSVARPATEAGSAAAD